MSRLLRSIGVLTWLGLLTASPADDWPHLLGPAHNATSAETNLRHDWPPSGPPMVWECEKGEGFSGPVIEGDHLVLFYREGDQEVLDCRRAATGEKLWRTAYAAPYEDPYGSGNGPRSSAVIAEGRVFAYGVTGQLHAVDLHTGQVLWKLDCDREFALEPAFFGHGSTPLVMGNRLIVQLGGKDHLLAAAFDTATGKLLWRATQEWGASYASPVPATIHGRACVLIFAGGKSRPPTGGLVCLDAADGQVLCAVPHRARITESVSASSPVVIGNQVFVTESYGSGGELIEIGEDFSAHSVWKAPHFGAYFMTPVVKDGMIIGCDGQSPQLTALAALDVKSGQERWRNDLGGKFGRSNVLLVDGGAYVLGEFGSFGWLNLSRAGATLEHECQLFHAPDTWTLPGLSRGLLYVSQNQRSDAGKAPRMICYDVRAAK